MDTSDPVAITGIGGRYPESKNVDEFWSNLISGKELCVEDDSRWPVGYMRLPAKAGKIPGIEKFDAKFFGYNDRQGHEMDPQFKVCHETTFEAIIDAGLDPVDLATDRTGMFIGYCYNDAWSAQLQVDATLYNSQWTEHFSQVSKSFGFKGPCLTYDSACASSFSAFNEAVHCIKAGVVDTAIVAGVSVSTSPVTAQGFRQLAMTSIDGQCRCMDKKANGYVRSETVATIILQRRSASKRIYCVIRNSITNSDGYKKEGITFPGMDSMIKLMKDAYQGTNLDPKDVKYIEAHVTGTKAGDPVECRAIEAVFCPDDRKDAIFLGCLKSNMGHPEGASGVAALTKACLIMQKKVIPPNINYETPNPNIPGLFNGKLVPVLQVTPFDGDVISLNSFGFGGTNIHTIIESYRGHDDQHPDANNDIHDIKGQKYDMNRIILFKARSEESFHLLKAKIERTPNEITTQSLSLIDGVANLKINLASFPFRGYFILDCDKKIISYNWIKIGCTKEDADEDARSCINNNCDDAEKKGGVCITISDKKLMSENWVRNVINLMTDAGLEIVIKIMDNNQDDDTINRDIIKIKVIPTDTSDANLTADANQDADAENGIFKLTKLTSNDDLLIVLGTLYMRYGFKLSVCNLYQCVNHPLPSSVMSVSPLISWDHDANWTVYKVPDYFRFTSKNKRLAFDYSTNYNYLTGHVIDGRIIFPAAQYLWSIWQSLAMELMDNSQMAFLSTGIKFWNVSLNRAIIVSDRNEEVIITTAVNPFTGSFEIVQDGQCLVNGHATLTYDEDVPCAPIINNDISSGAEDVNCEKGDEMISRHDFYKELKVRGYDYEDDFQGVQQCQKDGSGGHVAFLKNWVCFCDAVFQLSLINDNTRQLLLPIGFDVLQIDAKVFKDISRSEFELYEKLLATADGDANENTADADGHTDQHINVNNGTNGGANQLMDTEAKDGADQTPIFKVDIFKSTFEVFTNGLYIKGMKEAPVARKKVAPTLLKFEYHNFDETSCEDVDIRNAKSSYIDTCLNVIQNINPEHISDVIDKDINNNVTNIEDADQNGADADRKSIRRSSDASVHADIVDIVGTPAIEKSLLEVLKKIKIEKKIISKDEISKFSNQLTNDLLIQFPTNNDVFRHQLDIVTKTFHGQSLRITEVNLSTVASVRMPIEETLKNVCPGTSFNLVQDIKDGDADKNVRSINDHLSVKSIESELILIDHPSLGFNFLENVDTMNDRVSKYQKVLNASFDQMIGGNFLLVMARNDINAVEKALIDGVPNLGVYNSEAIENDVQNVGFKIVSVKKVGNFISILSRKLSTDAIKIKPEIIHMSNFNYDWVDDVIGKAFIEDGDGDNISRRPISNVPIFLISDNEKDNISGLSGFISSIRIEDKRFHGICVHEKHVNNMDAIIDEAIKLDLPMVTIKDAKFGSLLASKLNDESVGVLPQSMSDKLESGSEASDGQDSGFNDADASISYILDIETKGDMTSLKYNEVNILNNTPDATDANIIDVYYSALNFKDVMIASGRVPQSAYPASLRPQNSGEMGMEFSGVDAHGRRVMGLIPTDAIATKINLGSKASDFLFDVPKDMNLEEAATIPVVYATVYYALIMRGKLFPGECILIHAGSGGVGQAAIRVCQSLNCEVFTTVGTVEKRQFIKSQFNISDDHIFDSRSTSFADDLLIATNGRGVDMILNSLSEDKLQAGLNCLAANGRFIEIGKYDMITNSLIDPSMFAMNQTFQSVCLAFFMSKVATYIEGVDPQVEQLRSLIKAGLKNGVVKPLTRHVFDWNQSEDAFRFMASGKHIGKILIKMRDEDSCPDNERRSSSKFNQIEDQIRIGTVVKKRMSMDTNKSYLVIGGLGGMGLEVCHWLVSKGVRKLIVTSRTGVRTSYQRFCIERLENFGAKIFVSTFDVSIYEEAQKLIQFAANLAPVGGIFNLAMVIKDALFENQSKEAFEDVCKIKISGSYNLDMITRIEGSCPCLDHFVCFSSLVSNFGNAGQSNYGLANCFMDAICAKRRADGHPGLSIGWGAVGDVGHVAEQMGNDVVIAGSVPQRINSCLEVLEKVLFNNVHPVVGSFIPVDKSSFDTSKGDLLGQILNVLGIKDHSKVDTNSTLADLGLDSLMAVEIKQILEKKYDKIMSTKEIRELTIQQIRSMNESIKK